MATLVAWVAIPAWAPMACAQSGSTYDFSYHDERALLVGQSRAGRAYVPDALAAGQPAPLVVFLHGRNGRPVKNMWMGDAYRDDLRLVVDELVEQRRAAPVILAGPSQTRDAVSSLRLWDDFDVDEFVAVTEGAVRGRARIRHDSIVLIGHSGAGCNPEGGLARAASNAAALSLHAIVAIDTCLDPWVVYKLSRSPAELDLLVYFQREEWPRPFDDFRVLLAVATPPGAAARWRAVQISDLDVDRHNAIVPEAFARALGELFPPSST